MEMFLIYPSLCLFIMLFAAAEYTRTPEKRGQRILLSLVITGLIAAFFAVNIDVFFKPIYLASFYSTIIALLPLTYLLYSLPRWTLVKQKWIHLTIALLISGAALSILFAVTFFFSMANSAYVPRN